MTPIRHKSNNFRLEKPSSLSDEQCQPLPVSVINTGIGATITSFWKPTPEELEALNANGVVMVTVLGTLHPPVEINVTLDV